MSELRLPEAGADGVIRFPDGSKIKPMNLRLPPDRWIAWCGQGNSTGYFHSIQEAAECLASIGQGPASLPPQPPPQPEAECVILCIDTTSSKCLACGDGANPDEQCHDTVVEYGPNSGRAGCGKRFTHVTSNYDVTGQHWVGKLRPDLVFLHLRDAGQMPQPAPPTTPAAGKIAAVNGVELKPPIDLKEGDELVLAVKDGQAVGACLTRAMAGHEPTITIGHATDTVAADVVMTADGHPTLGEIESGELKAASDHIVEVHRQLRTCRQERDDARVEIRRQQLIVVENANRHVRELERAKAERDDARQWAESEQKRANFAALELAKAQSARGEATTKPHNIESVMDKIMTPDELSAFEATLLEIEARQIAFGNPAPFVGGADLLIYAVRHDIPALLRYARTLKSQLPDHWYPRG